MAFNRDIFERSEKALYVVSTYYHVLIACTKQLTRRRHADILCTDYIPDAENLTRRLKDSKLFEQALFIGGVREYVPSNRMDFLFHFHRKNAAQIERSFPPHFRFEHYDEIQIFHDDTWMAHYLKSRRLNYRLIEDALDSFKSISSSRYAYLLPRKGIRCFIKRLFRIGYLFLGADGLAYEIEVNANEGIEFASKHFNVVPRKPLFDQLTSKDRAVLAAIFIKELPSEIPARSVLLLTQPLYVDGFVDSEQEQLALYRCLADKNLHGWNLIIKPHPRDFADYTKTFPDAVILDKNMPSELLEGSLPCDFSNFIPFPLDMAPQEIEVRGRRLGGYIKLS